MELGNKIWPIVLDFVSAFPPVLLSIVCILAILAVIFISVLKIKTKALAIILATLLSCILIIPAILSVDEIVKNRLLSASTEELEQLNEVAMLRKQELELLEIRRELNRNRLIIEKQSIEIETLNESIMLLERAHLSVTNFRKIFEVALLHTNISQTTFRLDILDEPVDDVLPNQYSEILVVLSHDVDAKFGIDLQAIRISKIDENSIVVSGITPMFVATRRNMPYRHVAETRRISTRNNFGERVIDTIRVRNDRVGLNQAESRAWFYAREFQENLFNGTELGFMDSSVIELAQNFIKYIFSPFYDNIDFSNRVIPGAVPFLDYFQIEANTLSAQKEALLEREGDV